MSKWFKSRNIINITTLPWLQGVNFDVHGFINIPNVFLGMNEIHKKCNGSRYWSSNFKTSESGSSKDLVGLKGNYPYPKNTPQLLECVLGIGFLGSDQRVLPYLFSNWFRKGSFMFFQPWIGIQVLGFFWTKTQKGEVRECMGLRIRGPPQKKQTQELVGHQKTPFTPNSFCT